MTSTPSTDLFEQLFHQLPVAIDIWHLEDPDDPTSFTLVANNEASRRQVSAYLPNYSSGRRMVEIYPTVPVQLLETYAQVIRAGQPFNLGEVVFSDDPQNPVAFELHLLPLVGRRIAISHVDIADRKRAELNLRQSLAQEAQLQAQNAALAELSTPLIPISDAIMVMPLIGAVDSRRAQQVLEGLLAGIAERQARVAILDITGVPVVDTQVANALLRAAQAVKLLGAEVILTGIRPEVAQTLVGLGADLRSITTHSNLQSGIAYATRLQERLNSRAK